MTENINPTRIGGEHDTVMDLIVTVLSEQPHLPKTLNATSRVQEIGMDSLDLIVVFSRFEERWGVPYSEEETDVTVFETLGQLAHTLVARAHAAGRKLR